MDNSTELSQIAVRINRIEIEFKGSENFIETKLVDLLERLIKAAESSAVIPAMPDQRDAEPDSLDIKNQPKPKLSLSINSVIAKVGGDSCRAILLASAAHISLVQGKNRFTRDELVTGAKEASVYKRDYSNQVSRDLSRLIKSGEIIENAKDVFCLSEAKKAEFAAKLG